MQALGNNKERDVAARKTAAKSTSRKRASAKKASVSYKTLHVTKPSQPFLTFKITRQTIYWAILILFIIVMQLWILSAQYEVVQVTDQLNQQLESTVNE